MKHRIFIGEARRAKLGKKIFLEIYDDRFVGVENLDFDRGSIANFIWEERRTHKKHTKFSFRFIKDWFKNIKLIKEV